MPTTGRPRIRQAWDSPPQETFDPAWDEKSMRPARIMTFFLLALVLLSTAVSASPEEVAHYFLRIEGKAFPLERVALNGRTVLSGTLIAISLPLWVDKYLIDGQNQLLLQYTSDKTEPLTVVIEARTKGPRKAEVLRFPVPPGDTSGRKATKTAFFRVHMGQRPTPVNITERDRQAIVTLLQTQYDLLLRRDVPGVKKLYARALREQSQIYPEGVAFFEKVLDQSDKVIASPNFRMKPFNRSGIQFAVDGAIVLVSRLDQAPVMESERVEIEDEIVVTQNGKEVRERTKSQSKVSLDRIALRQFDGRWYLAVPFGP